MRVRTKTERKKDWKGETMKSVDISERTYRELTALYPLPRRTHGGSVVWHCRCSCGRELDVSYNELVYSSRVSCGCWKRKRERNLSHLLTHLDGTSIDMIRSQKVPTNSTTGVRGVYRINGKYEAKIVFQKRQYHLGKYDKIEDAAKARQDAEKLLFDGSIEHYERWKEKADADPIWAAENPIKILVSKKSGELDVTFLPAIV